MKTVQKLGAALVASALVLSACGGGGDEGSDDTITFMVLASFESQKLSVPEVQAAVEARVEIINDAGGIDGRELEPVFCNDNFDPNTAASCARQAVEDDMVAVVGGVTVHASTVLPILERGGVPWFGGSGTSGDIELKSAASYPLHAGAAGMCIGAGRRLVEKVGDNVATIEANDSASAPCIENVIKGIEAAGAEAENRVSTPVGAADYSAAAASAMKGDPDGIEITSNPSDSAKVIAALRQAGYEGTIASVSSLLTPATIEAVGDQAEGAIVTSRLAPVTSTDIPQMQQYLDEMAAYDPDAAINEFSLNAWAAMMVFEEILTSYDVSSAEDLTAVLDDLDEPIDVGVVPPFAGAPTDPPVADFPRIANFQTVASVVEGGKLVQDGDFFDPLD